MHAMRTYNVHDLVRVAVEEGDKLLGPYYDHYFRLFDAPADSSLPDYRVLEFSHFRLPSVHRNVGNTYLGFDQGLCIPSEAYALVREDGCITEYTDTPNRATNLWLQSCLQMHGLSLVHSAGLTLNGRGFLFPAFGGAGKTMLIAALRKQSTFTFFGDDYVVIDEEGRMHAYPSDFSIYPQHLELFPELAGTLYSDYFEKREYHLKMWDAWYRLPGNPALRSVARWLRNTPDPRQLDPLIPSLPGWKMDYVKVPATELLERERIGTSAPLTHCLLLSRYTGDVLQVEEISRDTLINKLSGIMSVEFRYGLIYLHLLASFGVIDPVLFEERQRAVWASCFANVSLHEVLIPMAMSPSDYVERMQIIVMEMAG